MTTFQTLDHDILGTISGGAARDPNHKPDRSPRPGTFQRLGYAYGSSLGAGFGQAFGGVSGFAVLTPVGGAIGAKLGKGVDNVLRR